MAKKFDKLLEPKGIEAHKQSDRQFVTALARGLEVLRAFQPGDGPLGNQELAERTGLPKPTVSRITHTLTTLGYLEYIPRLSRYAVAPAVLALGHQCVVSTDIKRVSHRHMLELAEYADATVALCARDRLSNQNAFLEAEVARRMSENQLAQDVSIHALARLAETRDPETGNHILRTQEYVRRLGQLLCKHPRFAQSLAEQRPGVESSKELLQKREKVERWLAIIGGSALAVGVIAILLALIYNVIILKGELLKGTIFAGILLSAVTMLLLVIYRESLGDRISKARVSETASLEAKNTGKLLNEPAVEPISSVTDRTTELLNAEPRDRSGSR